MSVECVPGQTLRGRVREAQSVEELIHGCTDRTPMKTADSLSGSSFERVVLDGRPHVLKYLCPEQDWIARATGDCGERQLALWRSTIPERVPGVIDHAVAGCAPYRTVSGGRGLALLLEDVSADLVPEGGAPLDDGLHRTFLDHMAALHAGFWGFTDHTGTLIPRSHHYTFLTPAMAAMEAERGTGGVPAAVAGGWRAFAALAPAAAAVVLPLLVDPSPLSDALAATPSTLVHGDWKLGNLGRRADGRTILLDWDRTGEGPAAFDLAWYLAVNCDRIAMPKEVAIGAYRQALERRGVSTDGWWERQLGLALLGATVQLGWAKALGDPAELAWWTAHAEAGAALLG